MDSFMQLSYKCKIINLKITKGGLFMNGSLGEGT
jgi:hypothetical protein